MPENVGVFVINRKKLKEVTNCHCVKSVRIRSYSGPHVSHILPHSDFIRRDAEYLSVFSPNAGKCVKNADQNNSEYGHFLRNVYHQRV